MVFIGVVAVAAMVVAGQAQAQAQCGVGAVGYWPMDGDGNEAIHNLIADVEGNISFVPGKVGQAADFDGVESYFIFEQQADLSTFGGSEMSFSVWIRPALDTTSYPGNDDSSAIITARTQCNEGNYQFYDRLFPDLYISKWHLGDEQFFFAGDSVPLNQWAHVAVSLQNNVASFYVDGVLTEVVLEVYGNVDTLINTYLQDVQVGSDSCGSFYTGLMDELVLYSRALSATEVADLYDNGQSGISACSNDADGDGITDDVDVCPGTTGSALADGCDCDQILDFKPGTGGQCNAGTLNVFTNRIGWAKNVPLPGGGQ